MNKTILHYWVHLIKKMLKESILGPRLTIITITGFVMMLSTFIILLYNVTIAFTICFLGMGLAFTTMWIMLYRWIGEKYQNYKKWKNSSIGGN